MDVILLEKIRNVGDLGEKVEVRAGYGRNYLIPYGKALPATKNNLVEFEARRAELEQAAAEKLGIAQARAEKLAGLTVIIEAQAADEGKLYGSLNVREIADAITSAGVELEKSEVDLPEGAIRMVGEHDVSIILHTDVTTSITVNVVGAK